MDLTVRRATVAGQQVVTVEGEIDLATVPRLRDALAQAIADEPDGPLVVDLDGVTVLDDSGLGVLLGASAMARGTGGEMVIVCSEPRLVERLHETRLDLAVKVRPRLTDPR